MLSEGVAVAHGRGTGKGGSQGHVAQRMRKDAAIEHGGHLLAVPGCDEGVGGGAGDALVLDEAEDTLAVAVLHVGGVAATALAVLVPGEGVRQIEHRIADEDPTPIVGVRSEGDELHETWDLSHSPRWPLSASPAPHGSS